VYEENPEHNKNPDLEKFESNHIEFHIFLRMLEHLFRILDEDNREQDFGNILFFRFSKLNQLILLFHSEEVQTKLGVLHLIMLRKSVKSSGLRWIYRH
jgi:hypothetical protein